MSLFLLNWYLPLTPVSCKSAIAINVLAKIPDSLREWLAISGVDLIFVSFDVNSYAVAGLFSNVKPV